MKKILTLSLLIVGYTATSLCAAAANDATIEFTVEYDSPVYFRTAYQNSPVGIAGNLGDNDHPTGSTQIQVFRNGNAVESLTIGDVTHNFTADELEIIKSGNGKVLVSLVDGVPDIRVVSTTDSSTYKSAAAAGAGSSNDRNPFDI